MAPDADPPVPDDVPAGSPDAAVPPPPPPAAVEGGAKDAVEIQGETVEAGPPAPAAAPPPAPRRESPLRSGLSFAWRSKRALLVVVLAQLLFGLSIALPFRAKIGPYLDHNAHASAFAGAPGALDQSTGWDAGLDWGVWADVKRREATFFDGLGLAMVWIGLLAWLFGQVVAGGFLGAAAEDLAARAPGATPPARGRTARFLAAAGTWFFPSLRVSLVFLALTMLVGRRVIFEIWGGIAAESEADAASQAASFWGMRTREGVFLALFLVFRAAADLGRAHLVVRGRRSAFLAFFRGLGTLARHPLKAGGLALLVAVPEMLLLFALSRLILGFPDSSRLHLVGIFLVLETAVLVRWAARAVLLAGNVGLLAHGRAEPPR